MAKNILNSKSSRHKIINHPQNETDYKPNFHEYENCQLEKPAAFCIKVAAGPYRFEPTLGWLKPR